MMRRQPVSQKGNQMKFLQEMIAKKRAQHDDADDAPAADPLPSPGADGFVQDELPHAVSQEALTAVANATASDEAAGDAEDDENLFDDGSYDWDVGGEDAILNAVAQANAEAEEPADAPEADEAKEPVAAAEETYVDDRVEPEPEVDYSTTVEEETSEEDSDVSVATSLVLKDIVARSQTDAQGEPVTAEEPVAEAQEPAQSSLEQSVQKIRVQRKMWDMDTQQPEAEAPEGAAAAPAADPPAEEPPAPVAAPAPAPAAAAPRLRAQMPADGSPPAHSSRRGGRVKTRLLGFHKEDAPADPVAAQAPAAAAQIDPQFPVGWMVVTEGPGRGASFTLTAGASKIGRGEDQAIRLDYGDTSISRDNHAAVAFDSEQRTFFIGHGGKANLVRLNDMPVLSTEPLADGDEIRIGETTLVFVAFCGPDFTWDGDGDGESRYAAAE